MKIYKKMLYPLMSLAMLVVVAGCTGMNYNPTLPTRSQAYTTTENNQRAPLLKQRQKPRRSPKEVEKPRRMSSLPHTPQVRGANPQTIVPNVSVLASHETKFNSNEKNRSANISLAAESINGKVVSPGEVFSFNEAVGPTIESRGYKEDIIFIDGEKHKGFGGGVCQVSTTLHGAAEEAGMTILERHDHSRPVGYAKPGDEAATSYGGIDFKFKNDKQYAVRINAGVTDGRVCVSLHSV